MPRSSNAYTTALVLLSRRELSTAQLRQRLTARKTFSPTEIDQAIERLQQNRALDDSRVARACAFTEASAKGRGRLRVLRKVLSLGIDPDVAEAAVNEMFGELDEEDLLRRALQRALRGRAFDNTDRAAAQRLYTRLLRQGFDASAVRAVLKTTGLP
jgi:SOS response regulatory protein OraA/RecX